MSIERPDILAKPVVETPVARKDVDPTLAERFVRKVILCAAGAAAITSLGLYVAEHVSPADLAKSAYDGAVDFHSAFYTS